MHRLQMIMMAGLLIGSASSTAISALAASEGEEQALEGLTLAEAVNQALQANPMVRMTAAGKDMAAAQLNEAKAGRLPSLGFSEQFMNSNNPVFVFGSLLEQGRFGMHNFAIDSLNNPGSLSNFRSSLNVRVPLFNRFQISSGIEQARLQTEQADSDSQWVAQQIRFRVIQAYYGLLVAQARQEVAEGAVKSAEGDLKSMQDRFEEGMAVASDVLAMQVQMADFKQQLAEAKGAVRTARAGLNTVMAAPLDSVREISGELSERALELPSQESLVADALRNRPDYQKSEMEVQKASQNIRAAKGQYWPDLNLFAQVGHSSHDLSNGSADFAVGASLNFNILDFGRSSRIERAVAGTEGARAQQEQLASEIRFEVVEAYQGYLTSKERLELASAAVDQAAETLRIVQDRQSVGLTTVTEVLRAQTAVLKARLMQLGARYDFYLGYARSLLAAGSLTNINGFTN